MQRSIMKILFELQNQHIHSESHNNKSCNTHYDNGTQPESERDKEISDAPHVNAQTTSRESR